MYKCRICLGNIDPLYHFIECVNCDETYHIRCLNSYQFKDTSQCFKCNEGIFYTERYNYIEFLFYSLWDYIRS